PPPFALPSALLHSSPPIDTSRELIPLLAPSKLTRLHAVRPPLIPIQLVDRSTPSAPPTPMPSKHRFLSSRRHQSGSQDQTARPPEHKSQVRATSKWLGRVAVRRD